MCPCVLDLLSIWILGLFFFSKGKRIPEHQEKTSRRKAEKTRITYRVHSGTSNTLKEVSAQTTGLTPGGRGNSKKFGIVVGRPKS